MKSMTQEAGRDLIVGDSRHAHTLLPHLVGTVALAVTSPPYHNAISYNSHIVDPRADYRAREESSYEDDYLPLLADVWASCWTLLRPGGHLAINVGTVLQDGLQIPVPQDILSDALAAPVPWEYVRTIWWNKVTAGVRRAGSVIKLALPGYWNPNIMTEHILILRKPGPVTVPPTDVPPEWLLPVWDLAPVPPGQIPHPAPFPEDLPHRLIRMLTAAGDVVFDPFLGAGTTAKAARDLGRKCAGCDVLEGYVQHARQRLTTGSLVREMQLRVEPVPAETFVPGRSRGQTRHGAGLKARSKKR